MRSEGNNPDLVGVPNWAAGLVILAIAFGLGLGAGACVLWWVLS